MKFKMKKNKLRIFSFLLALLLVVTSVPMPGREDLEAFAETFTQNADYSEASPSDAEKVCESEICVDCNTEPCICDDVDTATSSDAEKVCEECGAEPCECDICEKCEKDPCECSNLERKPMFMAMSNKSKEIDLEAIWASASNAIYNSYDDVYRIGFVDKKKDSLIVFDDTNYKTVNTANAPEYLILLSEYVQEDETALMYEIDSADSDFYFDVLAEFWGGGYVKADAFTKVVEVDELYVTIKEDNDITLWSNLAYGTNSYTFAKEELSGEYKVECVELGSASGEGEWFVKLEQTDEWPEEADGYVWMQMKYVSEFIEEASDNEPEKPNPYIPLNPSVPVIPENPELPEGVAVPILDENGDVITEEGKLLVAGAKSTLSAWSELGEDVTYQWQVCYDVENDLWVDIYKAKGKGLLMSQAMFSNIADKEDQVLVRCITSDGEETSISEPIPVILVDEIEDDENVVANAYVKARNSAVLASTKSTIQHAVTIEYKFDKDGTEAASPKVYYPEDGSTLVLDVESPKVVGYKPDQERITQTLTNVSSDASFTVWYHPDEVDYKVVHYLQNVGNNYYSEIKTETMRNYTDSPVGTGLEDSYEGFSALNYDSDVKIAADGSTVVNIYYDRNYYLVSLDLNGGYGVEPIYARYGTPIDATKLIPQKTGYAFNGWDPIAPTTYALPATVPAEDIYYIAKWGVAATGFTVAFWYENANDTNYTFVGSVQKQATTGTKVNGVDYKNESFVGRDDAHFTYKEADTNVEIAADGSTVVNVRFSRNTYTLKYMEFVCQHKTHSNDCYNTTLSCGNAVHAQHTFDCMSEDNGGNVNTSSANSIQTNHLNNNYSKTNFNVGRGTNLFYYVYFNGNWYRIKGYASSVSFVCSGIHTHNDGCYTKTLKCDHATSMPYFQCSCASNAAIYKNPANWILAKDASGNDASYIFKYEQNVGSYHAGVGSYRWCPGVCDGFSYVPESQDYGYSGAVGMVTSMPGGDSVFYKGDSHNRNKYTVRYWLESYDGTGTLQDGRYFKHTDTFTPSMGALDYNIDYLQGVPSGFDVFEQWACDSDWNQALKMGPGDSIGNTYLNFNFYYIRKTYDLTYFNGDEPVTTRTMKYEEPLTSTYNLQNLSMTSPYGIGYEFVGWYLEPECAIPVSWGTTRMPDGGMAVYAKWSPITHSVNTYLTKDDVGNTLLGTYTAPHGSKVSTTVADPVRSGYNFVSWFYEEDGEEIAYNFSMPVYKDMDLYAEWTSDSWTSGTITYAYDDGNGTIVKVGEDTFIRGFVGATKTYEAKTGTELKDGYQKGYFPSIPSHSIEFKASTDQDPDPNDYTFYYTKMDDVEYTVRYLEKDTERVLEEEFTDTTDEGKITVYHKTISGYSADAYSKDLILSSDPKLNVITFWYTEDTVHAPVQVEHYIQNTKGDDYIHYYSDSYSGVIGEEQTATPLELSGFTYNASNNSINGVELPSTGLVLKLYYDRNLYAYKFNFVDENDNVLAAAVEGEALFGSPMNQIAPVIPGYDLTTAGSQTITIAVENPANVAVNNVRTFVYKEQTVTIHYAVGAGGGGSVDPTEETILAVTGEANGSTATVADNYVFTGWYSDYSCTAKVGEELTFKPSKIDNVWTKATYYAGFEEVKADINYVIVGAFGSAILTTENEQVSILSGRAVGSTITVNDGYEFIGWYNNEDCEGTALSTNTKFVPTKPDGNWANETTYYAKVVEDTATIRYAVKDFSGLNVGEVSRTIEADIKMVSGSVLGSTASISGENAKYVEFAGWYSEPECTSESWLSDEEAFLPKQENGIWKSATYYAMFQMREFTISFDTNGGMPEALDNIVYNYGESVILPTATLEGHTVVWKVKEAVGNWEITESFAPGKINYIEKYGDVTLYADWVIKTYPVAWVDYNFNLAEDQTKWLLELDEEVEHGALASYDNANQTPIRPSAAGYDYTFAGWNRYDVDLSTGRISEYSGNVEDPITGPTMFMATYEASQQLVSLTVTAQNGNINQSYIYTISGDPVIDSYGTISMEIAVVGNSSVTVQDLPIGNYTVTGKTAWSWRQLLLSDDTSIEEKTAVFVDGNTVLNQVEVTFNYGAEELLYWLNGYGSKKKGVRK